MNLQEKIQDAENLYRQGQIEAAKGLLIQLQQAAPENTVILNNLGVIFYQEGKIETALSFFLKALKLKPADEDSFVNAVTILISQQDVSGVLQVCMQYAQNLCSNGDIPPFLEETLFWLTGKIAEEQMISGLANNHRQKREAIHADQFQSILNDGKLSIELEIQQFVTTLALLSSHQEKELFQSVIEHLNFQNQTLNICVRLLKAVFYLKQNNKAAVRQIAQSIQWPKQFQPLVKILLKRSQTIRKNEVKPARTVLVIIDHRGILKLFVNMLICSPELLNRYEFHFVVSVFYKEAELFGPMQELRALEALNRFQVHYDLWSFLKFIDNGSVEHSVIHNRRELLKKYPELMQQAAHEFCLRYDPKDYDIIITGLRSQTLVPMLRFIGYDKAIILYPVAPFLYYPGFRSYDNEFIMVNKDVFADRCFHVVAGDFYEDMYRATFPGHPFNIVKIPHGVNPDFYGKWQGDRETIFWAKGGITNPESPLNMIMQRLLDKGYPLDVFGYLCYENTNSKCNPAGAPESMLRESMIHSQLAIQYFASQQMIGYVEKLAVGIPTIGLIPPKHQVPVTHLTRQYRAEIDFIDREAAIALKQTVDPVPMLETKIKSLMSSKEKREQTSAYLRKMCRTRYNFDRYKKQWQELLDLAGETSGETVKPHAVASLQADG